MNIRKIVTKAGGFKGLEVHYIKMDENKGKIGEVTKTEYKRPIQLNLENKYRELRYFLLEIAGVLDGSEEKMEKDYAIADCKVTGVKLEAESFALIGEITVLDHKRMKLETPLVNEDDGYANFEAVKGILQAIVEETELYMNDKVVIDNNELVRRWVQSGQDKHVSNDAYSNMTLEEKKEFHVKALEEVFGVMVLDRDDVGEIDESKLQQIEDEFIPNTIDVGFRKEPSADAEITEHTDITSEKNEFELNGMEEIVIPIKAKK
jgi:hypothetical protein